LAPAGPLASPLVKMWNDLVMSTRFSPSLYSLTEVDFASGITLREYTIVVQFDETVSTEVGMVIPAAVKHLVALQ
jgi:hypothetical protein